MVLRAIGRLDSVELVLQFENLRSVVDSLADPAVHWEYMKVAARLREYKEVKRVFKKASPDRRAKIVCELQRLGCDQDFILSLTPAGAPFSPTPFSCKFHSFS